MTINARSGAIDALRVLGIVAVVVGHTWNSELVRSALYSWHVPVFFFLSGYLWSSGRSIRDEVVKRSRTLLLPYAAWLVLISIPYLTGLWHADLLRPAAIARLVFGGSYIESPYSAFWFVTALFVSTVIYRVIEEFTPRMRVLIVFVALVAAFLAGPFLSKIPLSIGVAMPCVIFLMAGHGFRHIRHKISRDGIAGVCLVIVGFAPTLAGISSPLDLKHGDFGTPVLGVLSAVFISAGLVLLAEAVFSRLGKGINGLFTHLAKAGFMVILTHAVVLWAFHQTAVATPTVFIAAVAGPWIAAIAVASTAAAPILLGAPPSKPRSWHRRV